MVGLCPNCGYTIGWSPPGDMLICNRCNEWMHPEHLIPVLSEDEIGPHTYNRMNDIEIVLQAAFDHLKFQREQYPRLHGTHARLALAIERCGRTR